VEAVAEDRETAAAARTARGCLLLVEAVAKDREGRGLTRNAEMDVAEDKSSIATGRSNTAFPGRRRTRGILLLAGPLSVALGVLSLPMLPVPSMTMIDTLE
jgi:hypothetical protein